MTRCDHPTTAINLHLDTAYKLIFTIIEVITLGCKTKNSQVRVWNCRETVPQYPVDISLHGGLFPGPFPLQFV